VGRSLRDLHTFSRWVDFGGPPVGRLCLDCLVAAGRDREPRYAAEDVGQVDVGEPVVGAIRYWVQRAGQCKEHRQSRRDGEQQWGVGEGVVALEVDRQRDGGEAVGGDEAVDGERAHPAVDVGAFDAALG
jgi:hypothetical protein